MTSGDGQQADSMQRPAAEYLSNILAAVRDGRNPTKIGRYHIEQQIGEGGMGSVFKAEQREPIQRTVAIKIIKLGMDTRQVIARFESERQALALMDHPNVAKVLDAGATETGRPYFVMEFVDGEPITSFCDAHQFTVPQRLELFRQACDAVQHAHQKAIIHRDLKPSNILVTLHDGRPWVKVIDFGVAKALSQRLTERTMFTETGQLVGTPEYMAPEQADGNGMAVDTRTDVYSLGVVLYELLIGALPFDASTLRSAGFNEIQRIIREVEPPRPSTRLSGLAKHAAEIARRRQTHLSQLHQQLKSELEWIPLMAMRKEPAQRYSSPRELSEDIENYLAQRPLRAGPETRAYRLRKFLRRNKAPVVASAAIIVLLLGGIAATSWQAVRATRAEALATRERDNAQATLEFLTNDVLAGATPENIPDAKIRDQIVNAMIAPAAGRVGEAFHDRPIIEASIRETIRSVLVKIGRRDLALPHAEVALSIRRRVLGEDHPDTLTSLNNYASVLEKLGRAREAEAVYKDSMERRLRVYGPDHTKTLMSLNNYAHVLWSQRRFDEAEPIYKRALDARRRLLGEDHPDTIMSVNNYGSVLESMGKVDQAAILYEDALKHYRRLLGEDHPQTLFALNNYAAVLRSMGRDAEAAPLHQQVLERRRRVLGEDHPDTIWSLCQYGNTLMDMRRFDEAEPLLRKGLEQRRRILGNSHRDTLDSINDCAVLLTRMNRPAKAEPLAREFVEASRREFGENDVYTILAMNNYARTLQVAGRLEEAERFSRDAVARSNARRDDAFSRLRTPDYMELLAEILDQLGRQDEAANFRAQAAALGPAKSALRAPTSAPAR